MVDLVKVKKKKKKKTETLDFRETPPCGFNPSKCFFFTFKQIKKVGVDLLFVTKTPPYEYLIIPFG